jgi:hypothetical protein
MERRLSAALPVVFILFGCASPPAQSAESDVTQSQSTDQVESGDWQNPLPDESTVESKDYKATLVLRPYDKSRDLDRHHGFFGWQNVRIVTRVSATWKGEEVLMPMSAYADLSNVLSFRVESMGNEAIIWIEGGDASASYRCRIYIKEDQVLSRRVESPSFPEYHNETTQYSNFSPDN